MRASVVVAVDGRSTSMRGRDDRAQEAGLFGQGFESVLAAARRGDEYAWTQLYLELAPVVTGYLVGQGCPSAEDVASETLFQVVRDLWRFDGDEGAFRSWVFTIAHHRLIDARRYAAVRPAMATDAEELLRHAPLGASSEDQALAQPGTGSIEHLLTAVTDEQRDVLLLRYVADLSLQEVGRVLGKSYNATKALHRRALDALREELSAPAPSARTRAGVSAR